MLVLKNEVLVLEGKAQTREMNSEFNAVDVWIEAYAASYNNYVKKIKVLCVKSHRLFFCILT